MNKASVTVGCCDELLDMLNKALHCSYGDARRAINEAMKQAEGVRQYAIEAAEQIEALSETIEEAADRLRMGFDDGAAEEAAERRHFASMEDRYDSLVGPSPEEGAPPGGW